MLKQKASAAIALAVPVLFGVGYQYAFGAPDHYPIIGLVSLALALIWIALAKAAIFQEFGRTICFILLLIFAAPLAVGPEAGGTTRWISIGSLTLHAGMLVIPLLFRLIARNNEDAPFIIVIVSLIAVLQPDAASAAAITFGTVALYSHVEDWKLAVAAIMAFLAMLRAAVLVDLPPAPFVERVLTDAFLTSPFIAILLFVSMLSAFLFILFCADLDQSERLAIAGTLFGFGMMAIMSHYPFPLIGFGASSILGYALALTPKWRPKT